MGGDRPQSHTRADSAICADCNWLITNCSLRSVAITYPRPNQAVNHRSGREAGHQRLAAPAAHGRPGQQPGDPRSASVTTLGYDHGTMPGGARGTGRGTARWIIPAWPVLSVRFPVSSVQPARTAHGPVVMVRRRSTVRFRNGAPGRDSFSNDSNDQRGTTRERRSSAPIPLPRPAEVTWRTCCRSFKAAVSVDRLFDEWSQRARIIGLSRWSACDRQISPSRSKGITLVLPRSVAPFLPA